MGYEQVKMRYMISQGNVVDGFNFIGPFNTTAGAIEFANHSNLDKPWTIVEVEPAQRAYMRIYPIGFDKVAK